MTVASLIEGVSLVTTGRRSANIGSDRRALGSEARRVAISGDTLQRSHFFLGMPLVEEPAIRSFMHPISSPSEADISVTSFLHHSNESLLLGASPVHPNRQLTDYNNTGVHSPSLSLQPREGLASHDCEDGNMLALTLESRLKEVNAPEHLRFFPQLLVNSTDIAYSW
jgi:hypothetical protein